MHDRASPGSTADAQFDGRVCAQERLTLRFETEGECGDALVIAERNDVWPNGQPVVGETAERSRAVTSRDIELFTAMSGDRNPIHYEKEAAAATSFGGIVVQGGVTTALLNAVVAEDLPGPGTVFLHVDWNFRAPVRPGDVITGRVKVLEVRSDKPITELATTVFRDDGVVAVEGSALCYTMALPAR